MQKWPVIKEKYIYKIDPRILVLFILELEYESKIMFKMLVIKEICSWLPPELDGRNVCSQVHISLITNIFNDFAFIFQFQHKGY